MERWEKDQDALKGDTATLIWHLERQTATLLPSHLPPCSRSHRPLDTLERIDFWTTVLTSSSKVEEFVSFEKNFRYNEAFVQRNAFFLSLLLAYSYARNIRKDKKWIKLGSSREREREESVSGKIVDTTLDRGGRGVQRLERNKKDVLKNGEKAGDEIHGWRWCIGFRSDRQWR